MQKIIRFVLDSEIVEVDFSKYPELKPTTTVLNYLRWLPTHKGVKEGCAEGDCGACTVVMAEPGPEGGLVYTTIDSCLVFLPMIHGKQLITVENLAIKMKREQVLHPVQQAMVDSNGSQCGYCTPGIVMSLFGMYKNHHNPSREIIEDALTGNLCRCTGYQPIVEAAGKACTMHGEDHFSEKENEILSLLQKINRNKDSLVIMTPKQKYFKPFIYQEALRLREEYPHAIITNGSTDVALRQTKKNDLLAEIIDLSGITELKAYREEDNCFVIGAGISLEQLRELTKEKLPSFHEMLNVFGSLQIRNLATLGGNIASASPIGDMLPLLIAHGAWVKLSSLSSERTLIIEDFILGYRHTAIGHNELIREVVIPKPEAGSQLRAYKVSKRRDLDISTVCAAFRLKLRNGIVTEIVMAYGGMAAKTRRAGNTENFLTEKTWSRQNVEEAMEVLATEFEPISDARSEAEFRTRAAGNILLKFYTETKVN